MQWTGLFGSAPISRIEDRIIHGVLLSLEMNESRNRLNHCGIKDLHRDFSGPFIADLDFLTG